MGTFFAVVFNLWFLSGAIIGGPYFWFNLRKTHAGLSPVGLRLLALGYGLAWPYFVIRSFTNGANAAAAEQDRQAAQQRILGPDVPGQRGPDESSPARPTIANPFDNR